MDKLLSIAVAAYNVEKYIDIVLSSLTHSKCISSLDIMVIDDGGSDNTMSIASKYAEDYPESIRLIHTENGGHGNVINTGIKNAAGEYFKVVDGDDHVDTEGLDELLDLINRYGDIECQWDYAMMLYSGEHMPQDKRKALFWFRKAAENPVDQYGRRKDALEMCEIVRQELAEQEPDPSAIT